MNIGIETEYIEFKKSIGELKEACESICAMLNKHGVGTIYFGVKSNGMVCGMDVTESTLRDVSRRINESIEPIIYPVIEKVIYDDKTAIRVEFNGDEKPYSCKGKFYIRTADEDRVVTSAALKKMMKPFIINKWDSSFSKIKSADIDKNILKSFYNKAVQSGRLQKVKFDEKAILSKLGLYIDKHYTNASEYLFGKNNPITLKMAVFATDEKLTFLDEKVEEGNIYDLINAAESYIVKNIRWSVKIEKMEREEIPEIPLAVIREIIVNSFAHAEYNGITQHEICIHPNMITIYNPGCFASKYNVKDYVNKNVQSNLRNELLAKVLYLSKNIERFGSGLKRIDRICKNNMIKYDYENTRNGFKFIIYRNALNNIIDETKNDKKKKLNKTEETVLKLLKKNPNVSRQELADNIAKSVKTIQRTLDSLENKSYIRKQGQTRAIKWIINNI